MNLNSLNYVVFDFLVWRNCRITVVFRKTAELSSILRPWLVDLAFPDENKDKNIFCPTSVFKNK